MGIIENMRLDGKAIYVTGAASGIGKCAAMAFAEAGADVAIVDINLEGAQKVADEIAEKTGSKTIAIECDVTKQDQVEAMVAKVVDTYGKLDACYNNAGIAVNAPAEEMTLAQWQKVIDINLTGVFLCATAAGRVMLKQGYGSIINTAYCKCSAATVWIQCVKSRSKSSDKITCCRMGKERCQSQLHKPGIHWNRSDYVKR